MPSAARRKGAPRARAANDPLFRRPSDGGKSLDDCLRGGRPGRRAEPAARNIPAHRTFQGRGLRALSRCQAGGGRGGDLPAHRGCHRRSHQRRGGHLRGQRGRRACRHRDGRGRCLRALHRRRKDRDRRYHRFSGYRRAADHPPAGTHRLRRLRRRHRPGRPQRPEGAGLGHQGAHAALGRHPKGRHRRFFRSSGAHRTEAGRAPPVRPFGCRHREPDQAPERRPAGRTHRNARARTAVAVRRRTQIGGRVPRLGRGLEQYRWADQARRHRHHHRTLRTGRGQDRLQRQDGRHPRRHQNREPGHASRHRRSQRLPRT